MNAVEYGRYLIKAGLDQLAKTDKPRPAVAAAAKAITKALKDMPSKWSLTMNPCKQQSPRRPALHSMSCTSSGRWSSPTWPPSTSSARMRSRSGPASVRSSVSPLPRTLTWATRAKVSNLPAWSCRHLPVSAWQSLDHSSPSV